MIEVLKQALEALETEVSIDWTNNDEFNASAEKMHDAITSLRQAIAKLESQEPVVTVPRRLALNTWAFLAQDCSPCVHEECQIGLKNVGVDTLTDAWNKQLAGNTHPPQRKPLHKDELFEMYAKEKRKDKNFYWLWFARAIEAAHGIKE